MLILVFACQENNKEKVINDAYLGKSLCDILDKMRENDQKYREVMQLRFQNFINIKEKRLAKENRLSKIEIEKLKERIRLDLDTELTEIELLTIFELQRELDNKNTELLIDIIKNRGYPNKKNSECEKGAGVIFRHSQSTYFDEIKVLINEELKKGNLDKGNYEFFMDHINGRKSQ